MPEQPAGAGGVEPPSPGSEPGVLPVRRRPIRAGGGNRTLVVGLEDRDSAIELHPLSGPRGDRTLSRRLRAGSSTLELRTRVRAARPPRQTGSPNVASIDRCHRTNCFKFQRPCRESNPDLRFTKPMLDRSSSGGVQAVKESNPRRQALETRLRPARGLFGRGAQKARGRGPLMVTRPPEPRSDGPDQRRMKSGEPRLPPRISSAR